MLRRRRARSAAVRLLLAGATASAIAGCGASTDDAATEPLLVAAAADLRPSFIELGRVYERERGRPVTFTFGSSGQLARQLADGAPHALFASASIAYVDEVLEAGVGDRSTRTIYAYGRLSTWSPERRVDLAELANPTITTVAIANPDHAPYGRAAVEALRAAGLYAQVKGKLVYGDNVAATQQLAASGNAQAAIIARSLAGAAAGHATAIDPALHRPIAQGLVVTRDGQAGEQARAFAALLRSPTGQRILRRDGFLLPPTPAAPEATNGN